MRTKSYITKYHLDQDGVHFDHNEFIVDFTAEFMTLLETQKGVQSFAGFEAAVRCIRQKWDAIRVHVGDNLPDKLWNYFFATVIGPMREKYHAEAWAKKREARAARLREEYERKEFYRNLYERPRVRVEDFEFDLGKMFAAFGFNFEDMVKDFVSGIRGLPIEDLKTLGLERETQITAPMVKGRYRELVKVHHPDAGGNHQTFIEITEAKNRLLLRLGDG